MIHLLFPHAYLLPSHLEGEGKREGENGERGRRGEGEKGRGGEGERGRGGKGERGRGGEKKGRAEREGEKKGEGKRRMGGVGITMCFDGRIKAGTERDLTVVGVVSFGNMQSALPVGLITGPKTTVDGTVLGH